MFSFFRNYKIRIFIVLFVLLLFHTLNNYFILTKSKYALIPDFICCFEHADHFRQTLAGAKLNLKSLFKIYFSIFRRIFSSFRFLFHTTSTIILLFNRDIHIAIMLSNLIYLAILLFATYGIGSRLYNPNVGLLAAFFVSMFPTVFALSRIFMVNNFSVAAMVTLTFYLFVLNKFNNLKFSLLTGVVISLGALTYGIYFVWLIPILLYFFLQKDNFENKRTLINFFIPVSIGLFISARWYAQQHVLNFMTVSYYFLVKVNIDPFFYLKSLLNRQLLPIFFLLFLVSLAFCYRERRYFLPTTTIAMLLLFSLSSNKQDRFILPVFPYIAVMISGFIWSLAKMRKTFIAILILFSFLQFFIICYGKTLSFSERVFLKKILANVINRDVQRQNWNLGLFSPMEQGDYQSPAREIVKIIDNSIQRNVSRDKATSVLLISDKFEIQTSIDYLRIIKRIPFKLYSPALDIDFFNPLKSSSEYNDSDTTVLNSDFIILEKVSSENEFVTMTFHARKLFNSFNHNLDKFSFIKAVSFPDNILCYLYKRNEYRN